MVQASPLGNLVIYDHRGPIEGKQIAYLDLLTETIRHEEAGPTAEGPAA